MTYLSRLTLQPEAARSSAFWRDVARGEDGHAQVWRWFSAERGAPRDFLFRVDTAGRTPTFLVLSARPPTVDAQVWRAEVRPFTPQLRVGQRLQFNVRVSPTRKKTLSVRDDGSRRAGRVDVVMDAIRTLAEQKGADVVIDRDHLSRQEGRAWLQRREERLGVEVAAESIRASRYLQVIHPRRGKAPMRFSSLDLEGVLVVKDPERFVTRVLAGIGPQKAFGCGLMLLRPAP